MFWLYNLLVHFFFFFDNLLFTFLIRNFTRSESPSLWENPYSATTSWKSCAERRSGVISGNSNYCLGVEGSSKLSLLCCLDNVRNGKLATGKLSDVTMLHD